MIPPRLSPTITKIMFLFLKSLAKILQLLNSETAPSQLAAGVCFGMIVGLSPTISWLNLFFFLVVFLLRVNLSLFFMSTAIFALLSFALDPLFDRVGYWALVDLTAARQLWVAIASAPILPYFRLNNTIVMGSLLTALILFLPVFFALIIVVKKYRSTWRERLKKAKWVKALKATKLYSLYQKYESFREKWG